MNINMISEAEGEEKEGREALDPFKWMVWIGLKLHLEFAHKHSVSKAALLSFPGWPVFSVSSPETHGSWGQKPPLGHTSHIFSHTRVWSEFQSKLRTFDFACLVIKGPAHLENFLPLRWYHDPASYDIALTHSPHDERSSHQISTLSALYDT